MEKRSRSIEGKLSKRVITLGTHSNINIVELLFATKKRVLVVNSWEFKTAAEAKQKYDELKLD